jgi:hypothetical protein
VIAVDKDGRIIGLLQTELLAAKGIDNVDVREADILRVDLESVSREAGRPLVVLGNLPYNISSQVIVQLIHARNRSRPGGTHAPERDGPADLRRPRVQSITGGFPSCWVIVRTHGCTDAGAGTPVLSRLPRWIPRWWASGFSDPPPHPGP